MEDTRTGWQTQDDQSLSAATLRGLLANEIPAIRIPGFASDAECQLLLQAIEQVGFDQYENTTPPIGRIGTTQYEFRGLGRAGKAGYFTRAARARETLHRITACSFDPVARLIAALGAGDAVGIAREGAMPYFAGLVRQINASALIHADFAGFDAPDWSIGRVAAQLSWNLYVRAPESGGECVVYDRPWLLDDERLRLPDSYGYAPRIVEGAPRKVLEPRVGDLVIFNCRNFHEVLAATGNRVTMSSFVGQAADRRLVLWS